MSTILDNTHAYELTIGGTAYEAAVKGQILVTQPEAGEIGTMRFQLQAQGSALGVSAWQEAVLEIDAAAYFGGYVVSVTPAIDQDQPDGWETYDVLVEEYATILDRTPVLRRRYSGMTPGAIVADLFDYALDPTGSPPNQTEFDTSTYVSAGSVISGATFLVDNETINEAMDRLALLCNFVWWIDGDKKVHFHSVGTVSAPFAIATVAAANYSTTFPPLSRPTVRRDGSDIRNRVTVYGGVEVIKHQETIEAGGTELLFQLAHFPVVDIVMITVDGVLQSWGTDWYHSFDDYDVLIDYHCGTIRWNTGNEPVGDIFVAYYYGSEIKVTVYNTEMPTSATVYGRWFDYEIVDRSITKAATAQALAQAMVNEYEWAAIEGSLQVERLGIKPGEELTIVLPALGLSGSYPVRRVVTEISRAGIARCEIAFGGRRSGLGTQLEGTRQAGPLARSTRWQDRLLTASLQPQWVKAQSTLMLSIGQSSTDQLAANTNYLGGSPTVYQWPVYDKAGALAGYVPLYGAGSWGASGGPYLLASGATTGASSQAQTFTNGIIGPTWKPATDSTTALQLQNAAGAAVVTVDTTNSRIVVGGPPGANTSALIVAKPLDGAVNIEGFRDESVVTAVGSGLYCSFDAAASLAGTVAYGHYHGFQSRPTYSSSGKIVSLNSFWSNPVIDGPAASVRGLHIENAIGSSTIDTQYGIRIEELTKGAANFAIYTNGDTPSFFAGDIQSSGRIYTDESMDAPLIGVGLENTGATAMIHAHKTSSLLYGMFIGHEYTGTGNAAGIHIALATSDPNGTARYNEVQGVYANPSIFATMADNWTGYVAALKARISITSTAGKNATAFGGYGLHVEPPYVGGAGTNQIVESIGVKIGNQGNAAFNYAYGLKIDDQSGAAANYALVTGGGPVIFNEDGTATGDLRIEGDTATHLFFVDASADAVGVGTSAPGARFHAQQTSDDTGVRDIVRITHNSTGTPGTGFGAAIALALESTTTEDVVAGRLAAAWSTATHASYAGDLIGYASDAAGDREGWRVRASGSAAMLSLFGVAPILRPTTSHAAATFTANIGTTINDASTFDGYTLKQVVKALRDMGILT